MHLPGVLNARRSMYQDVQQELSAAARDDLTMPSATLQRLVSAANYNNNGRFHVKQHPHPRKHAAGRKYTTRQPSTLPLSLAFAGAAIASFAAGEYRF